MRGNRQVYTPEPYSAHMEPEEVLATIEKIAPRQGLPIIGPKRGVFLDEVIEQHGP